MTQTRTLRSAIADTAGAVAGVLGAAQLRRRICVSVRLEYAGPGAHLVWHVANRGNAPVTLTKLLFHDRHGLIHAVPFEPNGTLKPRDHVTIATELDWNMTTARSVGILDSSGREHPLRCRELARIRRHLHHLIERPPTTGSARDWLNGSASLACGVAIVGLALFMLLWVIATG